MNGLILAWNLANSARYIAIFYCKGAIKVNLNSSWKLVVCNSSTFSTILLDQDNAFCSEVNCQMEVGIPTGVNHSHKMDMAVGPLGRWPFMDVSGYRIISSFQLCLMLLYMMFLYTMPLVVGVPHDAPEKLVKRLKFQGYFRILQAGFSFSIALLLLFSIINKLCDTFAVALALMLINFTYVSLHFAYSLTIALAKRKQESVIRNLLQILIVAPVCLYSFLVSMAYQNELCGSFYDNLPNFD